MDVKEEEAVCPMSGEPINLNHFKTSRAVRLKFKGNAVRGDGNGMGYSFFFFLQIFAAVNSLHLYFYVGRRGRLSKADLDTGWSKDDERQCSLCQKYGDLKPNVSYASNMKTIYSTL